MLTDVSEVCTASIIRAMREAVCTSETSINTYLTTWQYIPEDFKLQQNNVSVNGIFSNSHLAVTDNYDSTYTSTCVLLQQELGNAFDQASFFLHSQ
jgi:hypothetical protein